MCEIVSRNCFGQPFAVTVRTQRLLGRGELSIAAPLKSGGVGALPKNERGDGKVS